MGFSNTGPDGSRYANHPDVRWTPPTDDPSPYGIGCHVRARSGRTVWVREEGGNVRAASTSGGASARFDAVDAGIEWALGQ